MFELDRYSVTFGPGTALREASMTINPGDRLGVVGESGSGKTMLGLSLMGMVPDAAERSGTLRIDGQDMTTASDAAWRALRARKVAMIFQEPMAALNPLRRWARPWPSRCASLLASAHARRAGARWPCSKRSASPTPRRGCASSRTNFQAVSGKGC